MNSQLENIELFRMTHIDNIPHILKYDITHKSSKNANPVYITIGDKSLISTFYRKCKTRSHNRKHSLRTYA